MAKRTDDQADAARSRRFRVAVSVDRRGRVTVPVPFDPNQAWGAKPRHHVAGTIADCTMRGVIDNAPYGQVTVLGPSWTRDGHLSDGATVDVAIHPEGPQRGDLALDVAVALDAADDSDPDDDGQDGAAGALVPVGQMTMAVARARPAGVSASRQPLVYSVAPPPLTRAGAGGAGDGNRTRIVSLGS